MTNKLIEEYLEEQKKIARDEERNRWIAFLIENDFSDELISDYSGLSIYEIRKYKKEINCQQSI